MLLNLNSNLKQNENNIVLLFRICLYIKITFQIQIKYDLLSFNSIFFNTSNNKRNIHLWHPEKNACSLKFSLFTAAK